MNVLMLYPRFPDETFWNATPSARRFMHRPGLMPPLGLLTIASYLPDDFEVRLVDRNLGPESSADWEWADVAFISLMMAQQADYEVCLAEARRQGRPVAIGGPFTHAFPERAVADADWVCFGEAEDVMDALVGDLRAGRRGVSYQGGSKTNMEQVRLPRFELLPDLNAYVTMPLQFSRGCPFQCEFCDIIEIYGRVPRTKKPEQICAELAALKRIGFDGYVFLVDDNFIGNKARAKVLLKELAGWSAENGHPFRFYTEASINLADDQELLEALPRANFFMVFIGIETPDPKLLKTTLKFQNIPGDPLQKLRRIREHGVHITAGFIIGFDGEERGIFDVQRAFIRDSGIGVAMPGLLQALPHTQLSERLDKEGRLLKAIMSGISTTEGINFVPKGDMTKREYLERYMELVGDIYAPAAYFGRIVPALLALRRTESPRIWGSGLRGFLRLVLHLGFTAKDGKGDFWKAFARVLLANPRALEAFAFDCYYYHHLHHHAAYVQGELKQYLAAPPAEDVLDKVRSPDAPPDLVAAASGA
jgi:radical SAM superfamily enzyme YgiQ (UPF0313 family)